MGTGVVGGGGSAQILLNFVGFLFKSRAEGNVISWASSHFIIAGISDVATVLIIVISGNVEIIPDITRRCLN